VPGEPPIANFERVDDRLWCGARPDAAGAAWLVEQGIKTDIDFEWEESDETLFPAVSGVVRLILKDWEPLPLLAPSLEDHHIRAFLSAVRAGPWPIYCHCKAGQNRTRVAVAAYQLIDMRLPLSSVLADFDLHAGLWREPDETYVRGLVSRADQFRAAAA
jgi:protein tyrosine phosphatase (PTP) superfamily phosphohydrolase (DUF442 family)